MKDYMELRGLPWSTNAILRTRRRFRPLRLRESRYSLPRVSATLTVKNYLKADDSVAFGFDSTPKKLRSSVTLAVTLAFLMERIIQNKLCLTRQVRRFG